MPDTRATDLSVADEQRATFNEVLWRELQALRPEYCATRQFQPAKFDAQQPDAAGTDPQFQDNLRELYQMIGTLDADADSSKAQPPLSALCLSGGGIRSATFNLGVLQDFADFFARASSYMNPGRKRREFKPPREAPAAPRTVLDDE